MKKIFSINEKMQILISNLIYDIQNYNSTIFKYVENVDDNNLNNEDKESVLRQSFLIDKTMKVFNDFNDIISNNMSLNKNIENINFLIKHVINKCENLFLSKRIKIKLSDEIDDDFNILIDRNKITNSIFYIFLFIYNIIKANGFINVSYSFIDYNEDNLIFFNGDIENSLLKFNKENLLITICFDSFNIPEEIKRKLFKTPLINYNNRYFNNIYLYTSSYIINKHSGNIWFDTMESKKRINIIFPIQKSL